MGLAKAVNGSGQVRLLACSGVAVQLIPLDVLINHLRGHQEALLCDFQVAFFNGIVGALNPGAHSGTATAITLAALETLLKGSLG